MMSFGGEPITVLMVVPNLKTGGIENRMRLIATGLASHERFRPVVCSLEGDGPVGDQLRNAGVAVEILYQRHKVDPMLLSGLVRIIRKYGVDILQGFLFAGNFWGRMAGLLAGVPVLIATEGSLPSWKTVVHRALDHRLTAAGHAVVCNADAVARMAERQGALTSRKLITVPNGVDVERFRPASDRMREEARGKLGVSPPSRVVGTVCRMDPNKDLIGLIRAFQSLLKSNPHVVLIVVGGSKDDKERAYESEVRNFVDKSVLGKKVNFVGSQSYIPACLAAFDVFVQSSVVEGLSNSLMEALAAQVPVVATRVGGTEDVISHGVTGLLTPSRDQKALADSISESLSHPERSREMARAGRKLVVEHYSVETLVSRMVEIYDRGISDTHVQNRG